MYISITGLKPKGLLSYLQFWRFAMPSFTQARKAKGNLFCDVRRIDGHQCTLTAWKDRAAMLEFMRSGVHLSAMKSFHKIATGKTYGFESDVIPDWTEAFSLLHNHGRAY